MASPVNKEKAMRNTQRVVVGVSLLLALTLLIGTGWQMHQASADVGPETTGSQRDSD